MSTSRQSTQFPMFFSNSKPGRTWCTDELRSIFISLCSALLSRLRQEPTAQQLLLFSDFPFTLVFVPERKRRQGNAASYRINVAHAQTTSEASGVHPLQSSSRKEKQKQRKKDTHNLGREINNNKNSRMAVAMEAGQDTGL